jgi:hypothetical protein
MEYIPFMECATVKFDLEICKIGLLVISSGARNLVNELIF